MKKTVPKGEVVRVNGIDYVAGQSYEAPEEIKPKKKKGEDK